MSGKLYGVGIGPGDPELITLKAKRILDEADYIALPKTASDRESLALSIVKNVLEKEKEHIELLFPMSYDKKVLEESWNRAVGEIKDKLDQNKSVAFITLGDPTVYSTYAYIHKNISKDGYETEIIPGITSFCASSARAGVILGENTETIAVVPAIMDLKNIDSILQNADNVILMKVSKVLPDVVKYLKERGMEKNAVLVSKCGHPDEWIEFDLDKMNSTDLSYFTTMIIKKNGVR
ncbi:MAG: precorrin-2 C(20)-methyltransferase [Clostridia bacterium]|nr:precorrin-2 C(20)-methyltransferase [Clostridia bacterium]